MLSWKWLKDRLYKFDQKIKNDVVEATAALFTPQLWNTSLLFACGFYEANTTQCCYQMVLASGVGASHFSVDSIWCSSSWSPIKCVFHLRTKSCSLFYVHFCLVFIQIFFLLNVKLWGACQRLCIGIGSSASWQTEGSCSRTCFTQYQ